jgi:CO/xanthine dehydrogenase FAD-binding subunit
MDIRPGELLRAIRLPRHEKELTHYYRKVGTRKAQAISKICFAAVAVAGEKINHMRIAMGSVAPIPIRCVKTEDALLGKSINPETLTAATDTLAAEISPIGDVRSSKDYRLQVSLNLLADFLSQLNR